MKFYIYIGRYLKFIIRLLYDLEGFFYVVFVCKIFSSSKFNNIFILNMDYLFFVNILFCIFIFYLVFFFVVLDCGKFWIFWIFFLESLWKWVFVGMNWDVWLLNFWWFVLIFEIVIFDRILLKFKLNNFNLKCGENVL